MGQQLTKERRAVLHAAHYASVLQDLIEQARMSGVVLTIDRVPSKAMDGKHKSVGHARPARGYY